jgi:PAS domain-containing protein
MTSSARLHTERDHAMNIHHQEFDPAVRASRDELAGIRQQMQTISHLDPLLDALPDATVILNRHRQIVMGNRAFMGLAAARSCPDFIGMRPGEFFSCEHLTEADEGCGSADQCSTCGGAWALLEATNSRSCSRECCLLTRGPQGVEALDLLLTATPLQWDENRLILVVIKDISHQKRLVFLEKIFLHDILNTVSAISAMTELLATDRLPAQDLRHDLAEMSHSLVEEISTHRQLMSAEANEIAVTQVVMAPRMLLEQVIATCRNLPVARGKELDLTLGDNSATLFVSDESLLYRVLVNLAKNALEASRPGETVTLGCRIHEEEIEFWCHNRAAIPRTVQYQLFHRSFSTKGEGRGIGTYSVKLLTERYLQGKVTFSSSKGAGTVFIITLPLVHP